MDLVINKYNDSVLLWPYFINHIKTRTFTPRKYVSRVRLTQMHILLEKELCACVRLFAGHAEGVIKHLAIWRWLLFKRVYRKEGGILCINLAKSMQTHEVPNVDYGTSASEG